MKFCPAPICKFLLCSSRHIAVSQTQPFANLKWNEMNFSSTRWEEVNGKWRSPRLFLKCSMSCRPGMSLKALRVLFVALVTSVYQMYHLKFKKKLNVCVMRAWAYNNVSVVCLCIYECGAHVTWHACGCQGQQQVLVLICSLVWAQGVCHCFLDAACARLAGPWVMCTASVSGFFLWIWNIQTQVVRLSW